jgi:hypothetical protein
MCRSILCMYIYCTYIYILYIYIYIHIEGFSLRISAFQEFVGVKEQCREILLFFSKHTCKLFPERNKHRSKEELQINESEKFLTRISFTNVSFFTFFYLTITCTIWEGVVAFGKAWWLFGKAWWLNLEGVVAQW